ncbi:uncharacterized protein [Dysidea avara]
MFSGFLSPSTIPGKLDANLLKDKRFQSFVQIRGFPDHMRIDDIKHCCQPIQDGLHKCQECVTTGFLKVLRTSQKSNAIGWLASVVGLNELRCGPQFRQKTTIEPVASDGYMLNFSAVLVQLCQPFFGTAPNSKLAKIDPSYCTSLQCRLDLYNEPCLAHGNISAEESLAKGHERYFPTSTDYNFMTEIFHITQRGLHVGLMAAIRTFGNELNPYHLCVVSFVKHILFYPAVYWGPGGLVSSVEAAHPAVASMGTWCLLGKQMPNCPSLSHFVVLGLLWNFRFHDLSYNKYDTICLYVYDTKYIQWVAIVLDIISFQKLLSVYVMS